MSKEKKHPVLKAVAITAAAGASAYAGVSYYLFRQCFDLEHSRYTIHLPIEIKKETWQKHLDWYDQSHHEDVSITSFDGLNLHGILVKNHPDSHKWIIFNHGYHSCAKDMLSYMIEADARGFNMLAIDTRGCGQSEGRYTGLGWLEHYDLISWCGYLISQDPHSKIVLYGVSMGANAVMNAVGDYMPDNVVAAIEDGGYLNMWDAIAYHIGKARTKQCPVCNELNKLHLSTNAFKKGIDFYVRQFLHFSMQDCDTEQQLNHAKVPVMFIHGAQDEVIPSKFVYDCYNACSNEKKLLVVRNKGHIETREDDQYFDEVFNFMNQYLG